MGHVRESFTPHPMDADTTLTVPAQAIGGFLAKTSGAISVAMKDANFADVIVVDEIPVTAGIYTPLPFNTTSGTNEIVVTLSGGASGTLAV